MATRLEERLRNENGVCLPEVYLPLFIAASLQLQRKKENVTPDATSNEPQTHVSRFLL